MLTEKRFSQILAIVDKEGSVTVADLVQRLDISESTVRRDLAAMDGKGMLVKVYGGAISLNSPKMTVLDESIVKRKGQFAEEKRRIAKYAASPRSSARLIAPCPCTIPDIPNFFTQTPCALKVFMVDLLPSADWRAYNAFWW